MSVKVPMRAQKNTENGPAARQSNTFKPRIQSQGPTVSGALKAASGRQGKTTVDQFLTHMSRAARGGLGRKNEGTPTQQLGLTAHRAAMYAVLDNTRMENGQSLRFHPEELRSGGMNPEQKTLQAAKTEQASLEAAIEAFGRTLRDPSVAALASGDFLARALRPFREQRGAYATLNPASALVSVGSIRAALADSAKFSDSQISQARADAAKRVTVEFDPIAAPNLRLGAGDMPGMVFGLTWEEDGERKHIGFKTPQGGESGTVSPDMLGKSPVQAVLGAQWVQNEKGAWEKTILEGGTIPLNDFLVSKGITPSDPRCAELTGEVLDQLAEKGFTVRTVPTKLDDLLPESLRGIGGERHLSGKLLVDGIQASRVTIEKLSRDIEGMVTARLRAMHRSALPQAEARAKAMGKTGEEAREEVGRMLQAYLESAETQLRMAVGDNQFGLLKAVDEYAVQLERAPRVGADPFLASLPRQIAREMGDGLTPSDAQAVDWLLSKAEEHHGQKYNLLPGYQRRVNSVRDAIIEVSALVRGGEDGRKVADRYKAEAGRLVLRPIGFGQLHCLEAANFEDLKAEYELSLSPIVEAGRKVEDKMKLVMADALAAVVGADPERFGLPTQVSIATLRQRAYTVLADGYADDYGFTHFALSEGAPEELKAALERPEVQAVLRALDDNLYSQVFRLSPDQCNALAALGVKDFDAAPFVILESLPIARMGEAEGEWGDTILRPALVRSEPIWDMDQVFKRLMEFDNSGFKSPDMQGILVGELPGSSGLLATACQQARSAFQLVGDIAAWETTFHTRPDDVTRQARAMGNLMRGGVDDPMAKPFPATINFPPKPTGLDIIVPLKGASTGKRFTVLSAQQEVNGLFGFTRKDDLSESDLAPMVYDLNQRNRRGVAVMVPRDASFNPAEVLTTDLRAVEVAEGHILYQLHCEDTPALMSAMGLRLGGTFQALVDPENAARQLSGGKVYLPLQHQVGRDFQFDLSEDGLEQLASLLDTRIARSGLRPQQKARAQERVKGGIMALAEGNLKAYMAGGSGVACLLPAGQASTNRPDILSMMIYDGEADRRRLAMHRQALKRGEAPEGVPCRDGVEAMKGLIAWRIDQGSPVHETIFKIG